MSPLDCQTRCEMAHGRFGGIVRCLWLRNVDNGARHAADEDNATRRVPLHQMLRNSHGVEVGPVHVDSPKLLDAVVGVRDGIVVLGESGRCHQVVDSAMLFQDVRKRLVDRRRARDIAEMGCDFGNSVKTLVGDNWQKIGAVSHVASRVLGFVRVDEALGGQLGFFPVHVDDGDVGSASD